MLNRALVCGFLFVTMMTGCASTTQSAPNDPATIISLATVWTSVRTDDVSAMNEDLQKGAPTVDVGFYYPSNLDEKATAKLPLDGLLQEFAVAKTVFAPTGVQLKLLWVKTGVVDPRHFSVNTNRRDLELPPAGYGNMYQQRVLHPSEMPQATIDAFNTIIEPSEHTPNTIYLVALENVYMGFFEDLDNGRNWAQKVVNTSGFSFPAYTYGNAIPKRLRGVISLTKHDAENKLTIAHELGHKLMNVSHEYMAISPQHEIRSDDGLMLYGSGTQIPSGEAGRWHQERLLLSPYLYRIDETDKRVQNADYEAGGFYYDPLYGSYAIEFD